MASMTENKTEELPDYVDEECPKVEDPSSKSKKVDDEQIVSFIRQVRQETEQFADLAQQMQKAL